MFFVEGFLRWVYLARLMVAAGIFAAALLVWTQPQVAPEATLLATLMLVMSLGFTAGSFWQTHMAQERPTPGFLYAQVLFDIVLVTAAVHMTGGGESDFVPLYVLVITEAALLLPVWGGFGMGMLAVGAYFVDAVWGGQVGEAMGGPAADAEVAGSVLIQMGLFTVIALATVWLGDRLREAGSQLGEVESELRQLRLDTSDILATLDTGVVTVDSDEAVVYMNSAAETLLGMRRRDWFGRPALDEMDRVAPGVAMVARRTLSTRGPVRWYETHSRATPDVRVLGVRSAALERGSELPWVTVVLQDITDGKRVEALHRRAERLEAVTELAASLAHEIKNPLASIRSAVEQLTRSNRKLAVKDRKVLGDLAVDESDRLSRLLSGFIEFSRVELRERERVDLLKVVEDAVAVVRQHPDAQSTRIEVEGESAGVEGDPDLLHRVVFNLVLNAVQHSPDGERVTVRVDEVPERDLPPGARLSGGGRLRVTDRGPGIPTEDAARLFDPFFTTRAGGSGLGLALVHRAVEAHEGFIIIDDNEGPGTTFRVLLPAQLQQSTR